MTNVVNNTPTPTTQELGITPQNATIQHDGRFWQVSQYQDIPNSKTMIVAFETGEFLWLDNSTIVDYYPTAVVYAWT